MQSCRRNRRAWRIERTIFLVILPLVAFVVCWTLGSHTPTQVPIEPRHSEIPSPSPVDTSSTVPGGETEPSSRPTEAGVIEADAPSRQAVNRSTADYMVEDPEEGNPSCTRNAPRAAAFGALGMAAAMAFSTLGAAYGMAKSCMGVLHLSQLAPSAILRGIIPVVMAELLAIYGFISSLNIVKNLDMAQYSSWAGYLDFASGLTVGMSGLAAGVTIGAVGEANVRSYGSLLRKSQHVGKAKPSSPVWSSTGADGGALGSPASQQQSFDPAATQEYHAASSRLFSAMVITLIFAEGIGLYGMIVGMLLNSNAASSMCAVTYRWERPRVRAARWDWHAYCPATGSALFGALGGMLSIAGAITGAAFGIAKSGTGVAHLGVRCPAKLFRGTTPVIMSELLAVYGFVNSLIIALSIDAQKYSLFASTLDLAAGASVGFGCLASGLAIGVVGDACVRAYGKQDRVFVAMVLILIFAEALGLFSLIVGLLLHNTGSKALPGCP